MYHCVELLHHVSHTQLCGFNPVQNDLDVLRGVVLFSDNIVKSDTAGAFFFSSSGVARGSLDPEVLSLG